MAKILDRLPLLPRSQNIRFGAHGERNITFFRDALLVWLSISLRGEEDSRRISPAFPAMLDSGNTCEAYLHEHHLVHWASIQLAVLDTLGRKKINQVEVPFREADVWIYPNLPGTHHRAADRPPRRLVLEEGLAVGPTLPGQPVFPREPLVGFPALRNNDLDFWFDSRNGHASVRTADWRSGIIRLLNRFL